MTLDCCLLLFYVLATSDMTLDIAKTLNNKQTKTLSVYLILTGFMAGGAGGEGVMYGRVID